MGVRAAILCCKTNAEKLIFLGINHQAIYDASSFDCVNKDYITSIWVKIAQESG
jgi:hypothetical protein